MGMTGQTFTDANGNALALNALALNPVARLIAEIEERETRDDGLIHLLSAARAALPELRRLVECRAELVADQLREGLSTLTEKVRTQKDEICELHKIRSRCWADLATANSTIEAMCKRLGQQQDELVLLQNSWRDLDKCAVARAHDAHIRSEARRKALEEAATLAEWILANVEGGQCVGEMIRDLGCAPNAPHGRWSQEEIDKGKIEAKNLLEFLDPPEEASLKLGMAGIAPEEISAYRKEWGKDLRWEESFTWRLIAAYEQRGREIERITQAYVEADREFAVCKTELVKALGKMSGMKDAITKAAEEGLNHD